MFRRVLTYQLILAVAVGPLLCCCTSGRLLASHTEPVGSAAPLSTPVSPKVTQSCCAHKHKPVRPSSDRGHSDPKPAPSKPGEKCPCKDDSTKSYWVVAETISTDTTTFLRTLAFDFVATFLTVESTSCLNQVSQDADCPRGSNASLSTADLLFAHHNLRC
jgi:hypothetical protein